MKKIFIGILAIFVFFVSCKSNTIKKVAADDTSMYAMVYDYDNTGVAQVKIYVNDEYIGDSDVQGRFMLDLHQKEDYRITLKKAGYETISKEITFDPFLVLYFKFGNAEQFLSLAEEELDTDNTESALCYLERSLALESNRPDSLFLKAIVLFKQGEYDKSDAVLAVLEKKEKRLEYINELQRKNQEGRAKLVEEANE